MSSDRSDVGPDVASEIDDDMSPEYRIDYSKAKPNRFAAGLPSGSRLVTLDPDVAEIFPDAESVNTVLRALITTMPKQAG